MQSEQADHRSQPAERFDHPGERLRRCALLRRGLVYRSNVSLCRGLALTTIVGLAAVDSLNPATIAGVTLILLAPLRRPGIIALAYVAGAYTVVLATGAALFAGSGELGEAVQGGAALVRRGALLLASVILVAGGVRRLRTRRRAAVVLPSRLGPWTAAPLGMLVTGADLPNAFPYLIAIERLNAAHVPTGAGIVVLAFYALVYCLPCLLLLFAGLTWRAQITSRLRRVYEHLGAERVQPRSVPIALGLFLLAAAVTALAFAL
ncbi:GAP family protein [Streptosporangium sp. NPDC023615]|uniref:GAP family protein n=1 Tax=Streptosporangium sp. NPDC023615 TaxID=3154794 RepID=UPI00341CB329